MNGVFAMDEFHHLANEAFGKSWRIVHAKTVQAVMLIVKFIHLAANFDEGCAHQDIHRNGFDK